MKLGKLNYSKSTSAQRTLKWLDKANFVKIPQVIILLLIRLGKSVEQS